MRSMKRRMATALVLWRRPRCWGAPGRAAGECRAPAGPAAQQDARSSRARTMKSKDGYRPAVAGGVAYLFAATPLGASGVDRHRGPGRLRRQPALAAESGVGRAVSKLRRCGRRRLFIAAASRLPLTANLGRHVADGHHPGGGSLGDRSFSGPVA